MKALVVAAAVAVALAAVLGAVASRGGGVTAFASTHKTTLVTVELRVWQGVDDGPRIPVTAWVAERGWYTPGPIPVALDDGFSSTGAYRYGDITVEVPRPGWIFDGGRRTGVHPVRGTRRRRQPADRGRMTVIASGPWRPAVTGVLDVPRGRERFRVTARIHYQHGSRDRTAGRSHTPAFPPRRGPHD